jgi:hypothetical protein
VRQPLLDTLFGELVHLAYPIVDRRTFMPDDISARHGMRADRDALLFAVRIVSRYVFFAEVRALEHGLHVGHEPDAVLVHGTVDENGALHHHHRLSVP